MKKYGETTVYFPRTLEFLIQNLLFITKLFSFNIIRDNKSANKDEKMEKLLKKAKLFFDQKQKPKTRATSLWNFIGELISRWAVIYIGCFIINSFKD